MRTKKQTIRTPEDMTGSWSESQIIETIRDAYSSNRTPAELFRERASHRGSLSTRLQSPRAMTVTQKLSLVTVYRRKESFLRGLWRSLTGK